METYEIIFMALIGLAACFFGYRIKKIAFFIIWFAFGYIITQHFLPDLNNMVPQISDNTIWQTLLPIAGGVLLSLVGLSVEKICVSGICFCITMIITTHYFGTEMSTLVIGAIIGIIVGGLAVMMLKPATIVATALSGSYALTLVILQLFTEIDGSTMFFPIIAVLAILGSIFQFTTTDRLE